MTVVSIGRPTRLSTATTREPTSGIRVLRRSCWRPMPGWLGWIHTFCLLLVALRLRRRVELQIPVRPMMPERMRGVSNRGGRHHIQSSRCPHRRFWSCKKVLSSGVTMQTQSHTTLPDCDVGFPPHPSSSEGKIPFGNFPFTTCVSSTSAKGHPMSMRIRPVLRKPRFPLANRPISKSDFSRLPFASRRRNAHFSDFLFRITPLWFWYVFPFFSFFSFFAALILFVHVASFSCFVVLWILRIRFLGTYLCFLDP